MEYPKVEKELFNVNNENLQKLANLFPSVVKDGQLDIEALKEELGQFEEVSQEKYELNWAGKQNAKKEARKNVLGKTLRYIEGDGVNEDTTQNLYIEGDNLEVLKLLRKNYYGSIKMIYIDPPYNTGNDFVYNDNFSMSQEELEQMQGERDEYGERLQKNSKDSAKYHTNWLNMMYPRLQLAKDLLANDGVIFISIDENEITNLKTICDEVFSQDNYITTFAWEKKKKPSFLNKNLGTKFEYILLYAKDRDNTGAFSVELTEEGKKYPLNNAGNGLHDLTFTPNSVKFNMPDGIIKPQDMSEGKIKTELLNELIIENGSNKNQFTLRGEWRYSQERLNEIIANNEELIISKIPFRPNHIKAGGDIKKMHNLLTIKHYEIQTNEDADIEQTNLFGLKLFDYTKPTGLIELLAKAFLYNSPDALILDFFSGSATTAHAVMKLNIQDTGNRTCICVQLPEPTEENSEAYKFLKEINKPTNICEIGKERIRRAGQKIKEEIEQNNVQLKLGEEQKQLPDIGFKVFRVGETTLNWEKLRLQGKDMYHDYIAGTSEKDKLDFTPDFQNDLNVVYEIMLRQEGLPLTSTIEKLTDIGSRTYLVADSYLISLEENVTPEMIEKLSALNPLPIKFVFRDSAFDDDIAFKDETFRKLNALIDKNTSDEKKTYTVEFI